MGREDLSGLVLRREARRAADEGLFLGAADLSLAFERVGPETAIEVAEHLELSPKVGGLLRNIWRRQQVAMVALGRGARRGFKDAGHSLPKGMSCSS